MIHFCLLMPFLLHFFFFIRLRCKKHCAIWPSESKGSVSLRRPAGMNNQRTLVLHLLASDRDHIFGDTENAVAYMRSFARDTPTQFCSLLQNGIDHVQ